MLLVALVMTAGAGSGTADCDAYIQQCNLNNPGPYAMPFRAACKRIGAFGCDVENDPDVLWLEANPEGAGSGMGGYEATMQQHTEWMLKHNGYAREVYDAPSNTDGTFRASNTQRMQNRYYRGMDETRDARRGCANGQFNSESVCQNRCMSHGGAGAAAQYSGYLTCCTNLCTCSHYAPWAPVYSVVKQCYRNARGVRKVEEILDELKTLLDEHEEAHEEERWARGCCYWSTGASCSSTTCNAHRSDPQFEYGRRRVTGARKVEEILDELKTLLDEREEAHEEERWARGCCYWSTGASCSSTTCNAHRSDPQFEYGRRRVTGGRRLEGEIDEASEIQLPVADEAEPALEQESDAGRSVERLLDALKRN